MDGLTAWARSHLFSTISPINSAYKRGSGPTGSSSVSHLSVSLRSINPVLNDGVYVYCSVPATTDLSAVGYVAAFREKEGLTVIAPESEARKAGLPILFRAAWITLAVQSDLAAVGLTAAFATALSTAGISCNVIAGAYHDHIFVPVDQAAAAMAALRDLQQSDPRSDF